MKKLKGRVALVTGAGGGIGRAIAIKLAKMGMNIALCGRMEEKLWATADATGRPDDMLIIAGDLTDEAHLASCVAIVKARFGRLDVLVNNAGVALNRPFEETTTEDFDRIMAINVRTPFLLTREALPLLKQSDHATIINIGSVVSYTGYADQSAYSASKHALLGMTRALAKEVYADGVRVHLIAPGGVDTPMVRIARPDLSSDGMIQAAEVADAVEYLVGHRGNAVVDEIKLHRIGKEPFTS
jgi:3-oxoacyl-[acyl-carrier protein] reductase